MAKKPPNIYVPLSVNLPYDPSILAISSDAFRLYICGLTHCKERRRDGLILATELPAISPGVARPPKAASELVRERLWVEIEGGWLVRSWGKWNMSQEEIEEHEEDRRYGGKYGNHTRYGHEGRVGECPICNKEKK